MWPPRIEVSEETLAAEEHMEDLYADALRRWMPYVEAAVLPTLDANVVTAAGDELAPDPEAVASTQSQWELLTAELILPGVAALWASAATTAAAADAVGGGIENVVDVLSPARDDFLLSYSTKIALLPGQIRDKLQAVIRDAPPDTPRTGLRVMVRQAVTPGSEMLRKVSRNLGYHGAGILNHALMAVAKHVGAADRKYFLSRRDDRVRRTHRIADGQIVPIDGNFSVGGVDMPFPGWPGAPLREIAGCRCRLIVLAVGEAGPTPWNDGLDMPLAASAEGEPVTTPVETAHEELVEQAPVMGDEIMATPDTEETFRTFTDATIAFIGVPTSDYRVLHKDIELSMRSFPQPLMWMQTTGEGGHVNAYTVGVIEEARVEDGKVVASGYLLNTEQADQAAEQAKHGVTKPSVDLAGVTWHLADEDGAEITEEMWWDLPNNAKVFRTFTKAELMGMTLVATPAFGDTTFSLNDEQAARAPGLVASMLETTAAAVPVFPASHFTNPNLPGPTLPQIDTEGRISGHLACWGQCHRSTQSQCVVAPHSTSNYQHFHTSPAVRLDDSTRMPVGCLTVGTTHAADHLTGVPAQAHYANSGNCWALVRVGEDEHGIWFSGVAAPWATPEQIQQGLASPLSGDWRDFGEGLELVAALSVNTPGFTIRGREDQLGRPVMMVAALGPGPDTPRIHPTFTLADIKAAVREAIATEREAEQAAAMRARHDSAVTDALARAGEITRPPTPRERIDAMLAKAGL